MGTITKINLGAVGEHQVISRLLLMGYHAAILNMAVNNFKNVDIFCENDNNQHAAIQVKTTRSNSFNLGITHKEFFDVNGNVDLAKGLKYLEKKIVGPWVFVQLIGTDEDPQFKFFILSREQMIKMTYDSEKWYLTAFEREHQLKETGGIFLSVSWLHGEGMAANTKRPGWLNPFSGIDFEEEWPNLWVE